MTDPQSNATRALFHASSIGTPAAVRELIDAGADVNARTGSGNTPLHMAVFSNPNPRVVKVLIEAGANVDARNAEGHHPFQTSVMIDSFGHRLLMEPD